MIPKKIKRTRRKKYNLSNTNANLTYIRYINDIVKETFYSNIQEAINTIKMDTTIDTSIRGKIYDFDNHVVWSISRITDYDKDFDNLLIDKFFPDEVEF